MMILKFLFAVLAIGFIFVILLIFGIVRHLLRSVRQFRTPRGRAQSTTHRSTTVNQHGNGRQRQIFADDEGVYVDFEETN